MWRPIIRHWWAIEADFTREYHLSEAELAALSVRRFFTLLKGLSGDAVYRQVVAKDPAVRTGADASHAMRSA